MAYNSLPVMIDIHRNWLFKSNMMKHVHYDGHTAYVLVFVLYVVSGKERKMSREKVS